MYLYAENKVKELKEKLTLPSTDVCAFSGIAQLLLYNVYIF